MSNLTRISISLESSLVRRFDQLVKKEGFPTRSEAIKKLIQASLIEHQWKNGQQVAGAITMVYDHHGRGLSSQLNEIQHKAGPVIVATQHIHLDHHNCLEIITVKGLSERIRALVLDLQSVKGIAHLDFVVTTIGESEGGHHHHHH